MSNQNEIDKIEHDEAFGVRKTSNFVNNGGSLVRQAGDNNGNLYTLNPGYSSITTGRATVTTAGTAVQLTSVACKQVVIMAETDNTGIIAVGDSSVVAAEGSQQGACLYSGSSITLNISNLNLLYIDSTVNGDGITYACFN